MTMPSITARERHAHRVNGKFAKRPAAYVQHLNDDAWPDSAMQEAARINRVQSVAMPTPPQPWRGVHIDDDGRLRLGESEPVERETWTDWRAVGLVLFVIAVLAAGAWSVWA